MTKRKHLYCTSCAAHCIDFCLKDIGKKQNTAKVLDEEKKVTCFIYNHIWTVGLLKKYTQGNKMMCLALTQFATHFIQLEEITKQKQSLREMFNSKEFKKLKWGQQKSRSVYEAKKIVLGKDFRKKAVEIIKVYKPLIKVLHLVDGDEKPKIEFLFFFFCRPTRCPHTFCV
ncbi:hypothetical protein REPUB_Repub19eG0135500 [Reevesia pubescens]